MDALEAILNRRSIRRYKSTPVQEEQIVKILEAAMHAPSARDYRPWHFIVVDKRETLDKIPTVHPYSEMLYQAPLAILICGDIELEKTLEYIALDCAAATQNILLAAYALGLGSVWLGVYPRKERMNGLSKIFSLPENIYPISLVSLGYPDERIPKPDRFDVTRIHSNSW